ncbi:MAG: OprD family outer membrane porin [Verrucomicrobiales bacterium]
MKPTTSRLSVTAAAFAVLFTMGGGTGHSATQSPAAATVAPPPAPPPVEVPAGTASGAASAVEEEAAEPTSVEQGQTPLHETYEFDRRRWRIEQRRDAFRDTQFRLNLRTMYLDRDKFDNTEMESLAIGGWAGLKTGYFLDHISIGVTGYTSQHLHGDDSKDGAGLLAPGQEGYTALGELYADIRIVDDLNLYVGRKEFDTPFINRNDVRMTPNTFEAITLQGKLTLDDENGAFKYGLGYFDRIKERNSDEFVPMSEDAGASVDRGVFTAGGLYQKGDFSVGAIDYYSPDVINIGYAEAKFVWAVNDDWKPRFATQFIDQRSVGDDALRGEDFSGRQFGFKTELPVGPALFTGAVTHTTDGTSMQNPWSGYPGYTSVQVEDFNRAGETAFLLRAGYRFSFLDGLSAYALWVHGTDPDGVDQYAKDEYDFNLEWAPTKGVLKGLGIRLRYALVEQDGGDADTLEDFRVICNYALTF